MSERLKDARDGLRWLRYRRNRLNEELSEVLEAIRAQEEFIVEIERATLSSEKENR